MSELLNLVTLYATVNNTSPESHTLVEIERNGNLLVQTISSEGVETPYIYAFVITLPDFAIIEAHKLRYIKPVGEKFEDIISSANLAEEPTVITCTSMLKTLFTPSKVAQFYREL